MSERFTVAADELIAWAERESEGNGSVMRAMVDADRARLGDWFADEYEVTFWPVPS